MEKLRIRRPVIVEGKYDKITLSSVIDATILPVGGFSIFNQKEQQALIRRLAEKEGVIVLTDSDGSGRVIRGFLSSSLPKDRVTHLYIPAIPGKEKRKDHKGKAGLLGVEGMRAEMLYQLFLPFADTAPTPAAVGKTPVTKADFYDWGLYGSENASEKRKGFAVALSLPAEMSANALLAAVNLLYSKEECEATLRRLEDADAE